MISRWLKNVQSTSNYINSSGSEQHHESTSTTMQLINLLSSSLQHHELSTSSSSSKYVKPTTMTPSNASSSCITHRESLCQSLSEKGWPFPLVRFASNESITPTAVSSNEEPRKKHLFSTPLHLRPKKRDQNYHSFIHSQPT